jgi:transposase-like protein
MTRLASQTFVSCHRFVAVDGTFLTGYFIKAVLLAVGIDANGHNVILAWAVVENENETS